MARSPSGELLDVRNRPLDDRRLVLHRGRRRDIEPITQIAQSPGVRLALLRDLVLDDRAVRRSLRELRPALGDALRLLLCPLLLGEELDPNALLLRLDPDLLRIDCVATCGTEYTACEAAVDGTSNGIAVYCTNSGTSTPADDASRQGVENRLGSNRAAARRPHENKQDDRNSLVRPALLQPLIRSRRLHDRGQHEEKRKPETGAEPPEVPVHPRRVQIAEERGDADEVEGKNDSDDSQGIGKHGESPFESMTVIWYRSLRLQLQTVKQLSLLTLSHLA